MRFIYSDDNSKSMSCIELQLKARINNPKIKEAIKKIAVFKEKTEITDYFFDVDSINQSYELELQKMENARFVILRILTADGDVRESKEYKFSVDNTHDFIDVLELFHLKPHCMIHKSCEIYFYDSVEIEISSILELGDYVELKIIGDGTNDEEEKEKILRLAKAIGISESVIDSRPYAQILCVRE